MLGILVTILSFCAARGDIPASIDQTDIMTHCKAAYDETDRILEMSNLQMKEESQDNILTDWYGFERYVSLYAFGWKIPLSVSLRVSNGTLTGMNTMRRVSTATECSSPTSRTLKGFIRYGPQLSLSYDVASAKLFGHEVRGKFVFKPKLIMYFMLHNETGDCRLETVRVAGPENSSPGPNAYSFETESRCWMSWFVLKVLLWGLQLKDETPMMSQVVLWSQGEIFKYVTDAWCQSGQSGL